MSRSFGSPGRYIQRRGEITRLGEHLAPLGRKPLILIDGFLFDKTLLLIGEDGANLLNRSTPIAFLAHGKYWVNNHAHVIDGLYDETSGS